jgi:hypothetical protein
MIRADAVFHLGDAEREEIGLDGGGAVELPRGIDEGLDELRFGSALGPIFIEEGLGVALVSGMVLGRKDDGLACEFMAQSVQLGALFAGLRTGAGGLLGIRSIHGGAVGRLIDTGGHKFLLLRRK